MKSVVFALAMALPVGAAATAAMEPQQATQPQQAGSEPHHPLFTVKFVLRRPAPDKTPHILMDDATSQIALPSMAGYPSALLGALQRDPNTIVCYGRGCETRQR